MNERMKQPTVCAHTPASKDGLQGTPAAAAAADSGAVEQCEWGTACCSSHCSCCWCSQGQVGPGREESRSTLCSLLSAHYSRPHSPQSHVCEQQVRVQQQQQQRAACLEVTPPLGQQGIKSVQKHTLE